MYCSAWIKPGKSPPRPSGADGVALQDREVISHNKWYVDI
jgi:hypothetical protein